MFPIIVFLYRQEPKRRDFDQRCLYQPYKKPLSAIWRGLQMSFLIQWIFCPVSLICAEDNEKVFPPTICLVFRLGINWYLEYIPIVTFSIFLPLYSKVRCVSTNRVCSSIYSKVTMPSTCENSQCIPNLQTYFLKFCRRKVNQLRCIKPNPQENIHRHVSCSSKSIQIH